MKVALLIALAPLAFGAPTLARAMDPSMPGMTMPMPSAKPRAKPTAQPLHRHRSRHRAKHLLPSALAPSAGAAHSGPAMDAMPSVASGGQAMDALPGMTMPPPASPAGTPRGQATSSDHDMAAMPGMKGMDMSAQSSVPVAEEPVGDESAPPSPTDHAADRVFDPTAMAEARAQLRREHGGEASSMVMVNLAEYQARSGGGGYRWEGEASFGGDINRVYLKSEGDGASRQGVEAAEIQALYSRAVGPYFNFQAGVRQDIRPSHGRTYATVGFEGLAPYWFDVSGAAFISPKGELLGRLEGYEDFRLTQRVILQPRAEVNLSAQTVPELGIGSGVSNLELGLRLRYEIKREFAPYIGVSYDRKFGASAALARARGKAAATPSFVVGLRTFF
jgi:copper resistance protein B